MLILNLLPLYFILFAANLVPSHRIWRWLAIAAILMLNGFLLLLGMALAADPQGMLEALISGGGLSPLLLETDVRPVALILLLVALLSSLMLVPRVRGAVVRALRLNLSVENSVHTVSLVLALWLLGGTLAQLLLFSGLPMTAAMEDAAITLAALWEQGVAFVLFALLGVGLGLRRDVRETARRLGLERASRRQFLLAVGAIAVLTLWDALVTVAWQALAPDSFERISEISDLLFGDVVGVIGALTIGLSAGIGEELLFRGAAQPRFGLLITTLLFTAGHTQYEFSPALFSVFVIGLVLGVIRNRENTTTVILIHAGYNALNVWLAPFWS